MTLKMDGGFGTMCFLRWQFWVHYVAIAELFQLQLRNWTHITMAIGELAIGEITIY
jgi:hypothetical protein